MTTEHIIEIKLNVSIEWEVDDAHCCENDPYGIHMPISAAYSIDGGEVAHYYFGDAEDNLVEEAITSEIKNLHIIKNG